MKGAQFMQGKAIEDQSNILWGYVKGRILPQDRMCFFYSVICSFLTHFYVFTNPLFNHDSIYLINHNEATSSGRWLLGIMTYCLQAYYRMPWITAIWTTLFLALGCVGIVRILQIQSKGRIILSCALLNAFPTIACTLAYNFTASAYFAALMLAVYGTWCCLSRRWSLLLLGSLLFSASMGIYQAYISVSASLFVFVLALEIVQKPHKWKTVLVKGIRCLFGLAMGFVFYLVFLRLSCHLRGVELSAYRGINEMGKYSLSELPGLFIKTYQQVGNFYFRMDMHSYLTPAMVWSQRALIVIGVIALIYLIIHKKVYHFWQATVILGILLIVSPVAINALQILNTKDTPYTLMIYSFVLLFLFVMRLTEMCASKATALRLLRQFAVCVCAFLAFRYMIYSNIGYLHLQNAMQTTDAFANRVAVRVEQQPGYGELPVCITGGYPYYFTQPRLQNNFPVTDTMMGLYADSIAGNRNMLSAYLQEVLRVPVPQPSNEQIACVEASEAYQNMPSWPADGSVAVVEDVIVVKLSPEVQE